MNEKISPKYLMELVTKIDKEIWRKFESYRNVEFYIKKWYIYEEHDGYIVDENFILHRNDKGSIDLLQTLHGIDDDTIIKIAIDLGIETPGFIPCTPQFKNVLKETYPSAFDSFEKAIKQIEEHPDIAVGLANSTLESIIKEIMHDVRIVISNSDKMTLYELTNCILKEFKLFPNKELPEEIMKIGSSLIQINQNIEKLRSNKTDLHGKTSIDYKITDSMYAYFVVNSVTTVGLFLDSYYKSKYPKEELIEDEEPVDDLPF
ncbi:MAG: abortive infection family protein [Candidatus Delongbacteria bacterium]